jgi:hypothetical protein
MLDLLHLDVELARRAAELLVLPRDVAGIGIGDRQPQRAAPERRRRVEVVDLAVDDESGEATAMGHGALLYRTP